MASRLNRNQPRRNRPTIPLRKINLSPIGSSMKLQNGFGYQNGAEMVADQNARYQREQKNNEVLEQYKNQNTVSQFFMEHPEYPNTDQANDALETIINRNGWEWTPDTMAAAHALAVQNRVYQPLSQQEIAVANGYAPEAHRPTPPPMIRGGNPENGTPSPK